MYSNAKSIAFFGLTDKQKIAWYARMRDNREATVRRSIIALFLILSTETLSAQESYEVSRGESIATLRTMDGQLAGSCYETWRMVRNNLVYCPVWCDAPVRNHWNHCRQVSGSVVHSPPEARHMKVLPNGNIQLY